MATLVAARLASCRPGRLKEMMAEPHEKAVEEENPKALSHVS